MKALKLTLITLLITLLTACATTSKKVEYLSYKVTGDALPLSQITDIEGKTIDLANPEKRKLVILFATWCSDSQRALTALNSSPLLQEEGLEIIAIAREQTTETVAKFKEERGFNIPMATDPDRSIYSQFANAGIPRFIMVSKDNVIVKHVIAEGENQLDKIRW